MTPCILKTETRQSWVARRFRAQYATPETEHLYVLHKCNNPNCSNFEHLYLGTQKDNIQQAIKDKTIARGERQGLSKLTWELVREIRRLRAAGWEQISLAKHFGVSQATIWQIVSGKTWKE